jgi:predicted amidohydrolase
MLVNVALVQHRAGSDIGLDLKLHLLRKRPDFVCFPEYWAAGPLPDTQPALLAAQPTLDGHMQRLSKLLSCVVVGGTRLVAQGSRVFNAAPVFDSGRPLGQYAKAHPTEHERRRGIDAGPGPGVFRLGAVVIGVAICADSLQPGYFREYAAAGVDLLFVPNASPLRPGEAASEKFRRDQDIFVQGARECGAYVVKVCSVGRIFGGALQGRSLVAAPWGVLHRVAPEEEDRPQVIAVTLSLAELREFRARMKSST